MNPPHLRLANEITMNLRLLSVALLISASAAFAQPRPREPGAPPPPPQRFGPWDNDLVIATSEDGLTFDPPKTFVERGGVPHIARDSKNRLIATFQWFPFDRPEAFDKVAARVSEDGGKIWTDAKTITVKDLPEGYARPFDPTLLPLPDGRLRLYFTSHRPGHRTPAIYSALSADGDPRAYVFEPDPRLGVDDKPVIDCAAVRLGDTIHLYAPVQDKPGHGYHATSQDGVTFERQADVQLLDDDPKLQRNWLGCAIATADGRAIRFYGSSRRGVWSATSADGVTWKLDETTRAPGADPGVAPTVDGTYLLVSTGRLRPDAGQRRPPIQMKPPQPPRLNEAPRAAGTRPTRPAPSS